MKRSLTKVADFDKITVQSNYDTKHYEVPPDREVEEREENREEHCDGKGRITFCCQQKWKCANNKGF